MKRRDFIVPNGFKSSNDAPLSIDLKTNPLTRKEAMHLLRRTCFSFNPELISSLENKTPSQAFDILFGSGTPTMPTNPSDEWATAVEENPEKQIPDIRFPIEARLKSRYLSFASWWVELMKQANEPLTREKLTLFLSTIWCIEFTFDTSSLIPPPLLLKNNQTMRKHILGNYKDIALEMTLDGAMLLYQSLYYSSGKRPNENFMRELLELFTMGIGNYTEGDIKQGSLVLTGWRTSPYYGDPGLKGYFNTYFSPKDHDIGSKIFMGETIPARDELSNTEDQVLNGEVKVLLDIMFTKRAAAIASFISNKIYRYFVYSNPAYDNSAIIGNMSDVFVANNFGLLPLFKALFTSTHFFDEQNVGVQIKTPPEFIITFQNQMGINYPNARKAIFDCEQELYDPPNVGSWKGYRTWQSMKTYPLRIKYAQEILAQTPNPNLVALARKMDNYESSTQLTVSLLQYFLPTEVTQDRINYYHELLLSKSESTPQTWSDTVNNNETKAADGIRELISKVILAPDFQLC